MLAVEASTTAVVSSLNVNLPVKNIQLVGRISAQPKYYPYRSGDRGSWTFPLKCKSINVHNGQRRLRGDIQVRVSGTTSDNCFLVGQQIRVTGELRKRNFPGGEPFEMVVRQQSWKLLERAPTFSLKRWGQHLRERASGRLSIGIENHETQLAVFKALLLGYRKAIPHDTYDQFRRTGTVHIFAISGLHVGMVGMLLIVVLKTIGIPYGRWGLLLLPLLFIYVASTGMKSSALRAFTMASVYFVAPLVRRKPDVPTAVAVAALLLLWIKPSEIQSIGFILSFTVVSFIIMAFAIIPEGLIHKRRGWVHGIWNYVVSLVITSLAAGIASIPLVALYFGTYSPVALISNLFVVPLTFGIVLSGWLSILVPFASELFNHAALIFINSILVSTSWFSNLPGACWEIPTPPLAAVFMWYIGWIVFFTHSRKSRKDLTSPCLILVSMIITAVSIVLSR